MNRRLGLGVLFVLCAARAYAADEAPLPPGDAKPVLQLEAGGPTAAVTALVFSQDGKTLYVAGLDKVVRVWEQDDDKKPAWALKRAFRVPIGPGVSGAINALALSPDGRWLAVGGRSVMRGEAEFRHPGLVVPITALSETMWRDSGTIHVFDLTNPAGGKVLRGHEGEVRALAFAPERPGKPPLLVSAAIERGRGAASGSVRLWDIEKGGEPLAVLDKLPSPPLEKERPGLAVWHTGDGNKQIRAVIVWPSFELNDQVKIADIKDEQGRLFVWDAAGGDGALQRWTMGPGNSTAALLGFAGDEPRVVTGRVGKFGDNTVTGGLWVWRFSRGADTTAKIERAVPFVFEDVRYRPFALAPVSSRADGRLDYVAAVLQPSDEKLDHRLALTELAANSAAVRVRLALKNTDPNHAPVVAASPRGRWLAVAGFKDRAIELYAVADLLDGRREPAVRLNARGVRYKKAVFVRRDKETGLWLSEDADAKPLQGGIFFSFDKRALTDDAKGWAADAPDRAGLRPTFAKDDKTRTFTITVGDYPKMTLQEGQEPTWYAVRPPTPQRKQGLFAVAHTNRASAETYITLFDLATGQPLRQFTGHLQDVRWLEFSDTHPLLVSASDDQTVNVWSFADLGAGVGMIQGLVVSERDGKVVALSVAPNSDAAKAGIKKDDVIEGFVVEGKVQAVKSAVDFYWTVNLKKPGDLIDVKVAGREAVRVKAGQGVEERKPLLSLFVTRDRKEWIGWTPGGPFDRSSERVDTLIGWHTNTGKPEQPATFAAAKEYQAEFYKQNILKYLVAEGTLAGALKAWDKNEKEPPPEPELTPDVRGAKRDLDRPELFHVRDRNVTLTTKLNAAYPLDERDVVRWQAVTPNGEKLEARPMKRVGERAWEADLSALPWKQGEFRVEVQFRSDARNKQAAQALTLRYQPPAPQLSGTIGDKDVKAGAEPFVVNVTEPKVAVAVKVEPEAGQTVELRFVQPGAQDPPKPRTVAKRDSFSQDFTLLEGVNHLEIVVVNKDALKGFEANETSVLRLDVQYRKPEKQPPPQITALRLTPPPSDSFRDADGKEVLVVDQNKLAVESTVEAKDPLTLAEWSAGGEKAKSLLEPKPSNKLTLQQTVTLLPGKTTLLQVRAATKTSDPADATLRVVYRPLLPKIGIGPPNDGPVVYADKVTLGGVFLVQAPDEKYQFDVRVKDAKGKDVGSGKATVNEKKESWTAEVPLAPGENVIDATVKSEWRPAVTERLTVAYKRPPVVAPISEIKVGDKPFVDVAAKVWSPAELKVLAVLIDGVKKPAELKETDEVKDGLKLWNVAVKGVSVKDGEKWLKSLAVSARNADGESRKAETVTIKPPDKPAPKAPVVKLLMNDQDTTQQSKYTVSYAVESDSPLKSVEVWRGEERVYQSDLTQVKKVGTTFELRESAPVPLEWEANRLRVTAVNDGGTGTSAEKVVTVPRPPVRIVLERLDVLGPGGDVRESLTPLEQTAEQVRFDEPQRGFVFLRGRVEWTDDKAPQLDDPLLNVVAYVNGSRQFPVALEPRGGGSRGRQRAFGVPLVLTKPRDNVIVIDLPRLPQSAVSKREFRVGCKQSEQQQRLHVLIVGVNVKDGEALKTGVLSVVGKDAPRGFEGEFTSPAFERARLAGVLFGNVQKEAVIGQLGEIEKQIAVLQEQTKRMNDVVFIYYQGGEAEDKRGKRYLKTSLNEKFPNLPLEKTALPYDDLPRMPGVQLMVLNVSRPTSQGGATVKDDAWRPSDSHLGLMRYVMREPSDAVLKAAQRATQEQATIKEFNERATSEVKKDKDALAQDAQIPEGVGDRLFSKPK
jgi:WD40 repeat protein